MTDRCARCAAKTTCVNDRCLTRSVLTCPAYRSPSCTDARRSGLQRKTYIQELTSERLNLSTLAEMVDNDQEPPHRAGWLDRVDIVAGSGYASSDVRAYALQMRVTESAGADRG